MTTAAATTSGIDDLRTRIAAVQARFTELGLRAARAAADVAVVGMPPSERLLAQLAATAAEFQALREEVLESVATLANVDRHRRHEAGRAAALHVIDRVQAIVHRDDPNFAPLAECQASARAMHEEIASAEATDDDVIAWAERLRPFAALLEMLEGGVENARFAELADGVAAAFGPPLASAAMRGRLQLQ